MKYFPPVTGTWLFMVRSDDAQCALFFPAVNALSLFTFLFPERENSYSPQIVPRPVGDPSRQRFSKRCGQK
jgi:hypothetical protein